MKLAKGYYPKPAHRGGAMRKPHVKTRYPKGKGNKTITMK